MRAVTMRDVGMVVLGVGLGVLLAWRPAEEVRAPVCAPAPAAAVTVAAPPLPPVIVRPAPPEPAAVDRPSAAQQQQIARLEETIALQEHAQKERLGQVAIEAPPGLPPRFFEGGQLRVLAEALVADAGLSDAVVELRCDEYPCLAQLKNLPSMAEAMRLMREVRGGAFAQDQRLAMSFSDENLIDGGSRAGAMIAFIPAAEPAERRKAVEARIQQRLAR